MFDIALRPLKDQIFDRTCRLIPHSISPGHLTFTAFATGVLSCLAATQRKPLLAASFWLLNRVLDCFDGAVARQRNQSTDLGGFLDLLSDFIIYSLIPICCGLGPSPDASGTATVRLWAAISCAEATFHVNNFVLFYIAAITEKQKAAKAQGAADGTGAEKDGWKIKELTSLSMRPALVEGAESGLIFTVMLAMPEWTELLCWVLAVGVVIGTMQRVYWIVHVL